MKPAPSATEEARCEAPPPSLGAPPRAVRAGRGSMTAQRVESVVRRVRARVDIASRAGETMTLLQHVQLLQLVCIPEEGVLR